MKELRNLAENAGFALFRRYLPLAFLIATFVIAAPFFALWELFKIEFFRTISFSLFLLGLLASIFTSREVLIRMEHDKAMLFSDALTHTLYRYLTFLCFLPLIGPPLQRFLEKQREKNPFTSHEK